MKRILNLGALTIVAGLAIACGDGDSSGGDGDSGASGDGDTAGDGDGDTAGDGDGDTAGDGDGDTAGDGDGDTAGDGDGDTAGDGDGDTGTMPNPCDPADPGENDCPDYVACAENKCTDSYKTCLGDGFETGNFEGGECQSYMECVSACNKGDVCDTSCTQACEIDLACQNCTFNEIGGCLVSECSAELNACSDVDIPDVNFDAGCAELETCCSSLSGSEASACEQGLVASAGLDLACGILFETYVLVGQCSE